MRTHLWNRPQTCRNALFGVSAGHELKRNASQSSRVHDIVGVIENPALVNAVAILVCRELVVCSADDSAATEFGDCLFVQAPAARAGGIDRHLFSVRLFR